MPGKSEKPHRIRVRILDGKPRDVKELNLLKSKQLNMPYIDFHGSGVEFVVCAATEKHIAQLREKVERSGLEEVVDGDVAVPAIAPPAAPPKEKFGSKGPSHNDGARGRGPQDINRNQSMTPETDKANLNKKPYGFVALPSALTTSAPIWHDGTSSTGRLSGEIRFELETLTPLLVGWERQKIVPTEDEKFEPWPIQYEDKGDDTVSMNLQDRWSGAIGAGKSVLCPLRAPWGERPVIIPGDSLKGLLRHELGALLGAPMERVAERSYSYRPNALYPLQSQNRFLVPRLARIPHDPHDCVVTRPLVGEHQARVPTRLELFPANLEYNKKAKRLDYHFDQPGGAPYRGGQGAGQQLNSKPTVHTSLSVLRTASTDAVEVPAEAQSGYLKTVRHLVDLDHGHFSERHPDVPKRNGKRESIDGEAAQKRILKAAGHEVFEPGDFIWVEWDTEKKCIVSLGWHYYYRWAYTDSVRKTDGKLERHGLFPLDGERSQDADGAPKGLSPVRRLFGYTGDSDGSSGIGNDDHSQLMGRISVNSALEVVEEHDTPDTRFLKPMFLKELGMPRPSAVEHYLKQNVDAQGRPQKRPSDQAKLVTYGDAVGPDTPGELAGRKFYLDRRDAYRDDGSSKEKDGPWADASETNRLNDRSTLALEVSKPKRKFRFTIRVRDLESAELAALLVALCPHQFKDVLGGTHSDGYCSKLGYARPLGWGSVRIEAKALLLLDEIGNMPKLEPVNDIAEWVSTNHQPTTMQNEWLAIHQRNHRYANDYPRNDGQIYTYHTTLRGEHSRARRYRNTGDS